MCPWLQKASMQNMLRENETPDMHNCTVIGSSAVRSFSVKAVDVDGCVCFCPRALTHL